jgi:GNAT superfamily N-acetyltransferase
MSAQEHLNGIQFKVHAPENSRTGYVHAYDENEPVADNALFPEIGHLYWHRSLDPSRPSVIDDMSVSPDYRRRGIATQMYQTAVEHEGAPIQHSPERTNAGDAWAKSVGGVRPRRKRIR